MTVHSAGDTAEAARLREARSAVELLQHKTGAEHVREGVSLWRLWGPYLADRQWGTVREDYSADGNAWDYLPHDHARSRAYRWGEDGLLGICDEMSRICFAPALWNGADPFLKERLFGLANPQGNHGEDVKEYYFYLDNTPTHSYMKALYKYPQRAFPYEELLRVNAERGKDEPEYELLDTGIFDDDRYFDITMEYAKAAADDIVVRITATNRGPEAAPLHILPTLWFRNTWSWGYDNPRPSLRAADAPGSSAVRAEHRELGDYFLYCEGAPGLLFTDNETNADRLWNEPRSPRFAKDAFHDVVVGGKSDAANLQVGTKAAAHYVLDLASRDSASITLRLTARELPAPFADAGQIIDQRKREADEFYHALQPANMPDDARAVQRQAFAGLLWSKQFFYYDVDEWLRGDPAGDPPPTERLKGRNSEWRHLNNADVILMPDAWEYPWYAAWDLAFHCVTMAHIDPEFAKSQLILMLREWYMHPNGQLPAYEWSFNDVNPPVHAWAALNVFRIERDATGRGDHEFLERVFQKMLLNFTWWVNRKDAEGNNVFGGGFLGLDNIGVFDRNIVLPSGVQLEQSDGTAWMGMYCLNMLAIALELASDDRVYEDLATKFFEHFMYIAGALNNIGRWGAGVSLWDDEDQFFYDTLHADDGRTVQLKVRSLVGLLPLLAVATGDTTLLDGMPEFSRSMDWFLRHRPQLAEVVARWDEPGGQEQRLVSLVHGQRMKHLLHRMLDPEEFLSDYGIRSISRYHRDHPYVFRAQDQEFSVEYAPGESTSGLFGGNSNWRGPIWMPVNFLLIQALDIFHRYYGDDFRIEHPTGSGTYLSLKQIADDLSRRLASIFLRAADGTRPVYGTIEKFQRDPHWRDHVLFHEYFHGDTGRGVGASHQTGWTALVANLLLREGLFDAKA